MTEVKVPMMVVWHHEFIMNSAVSTDKSVELDVRGLEPPQPLMAILEALMDLPPGSELVARTDRRPMHLYDQLEIRGYFGLTRQLPDGSYRTHIRSRQSTDPSPRSP